MPGGAEALPFVRLFYGQPSQYLWEDAEGTVHTVEQGEGGEQGDPLMSLLFSLGQHAALEAAHSRMRTGETLFAFLDDVYFVVTRQGRRCVSGCGARVVQTFSDQNPHGQDSSVEFSRS